MATENNIIELRHVKKCYEKDTPVIKDFSLTIKKGEFAYNRSTSKDAPVGAVRRLVDYEEGVLSTLYLVFSITDPQHVDPNYLSYFFETTGWHSWILERAAEGARNHGLLNVSSQDFLSLPVMLSSSLEEQQKIGEFFQKIRSPSCFILVTRNPPFISMQKLLYSSLLKTYYIGVLLSRVYMS